MLAESILVQELPHLLPCPVLNAQGQSRQGATRDVTHETASNRAGVFYKVHPALRHLYLRDERLQRERDQLGRLGRHERGSVPCSLASSATIRVVEDLVQGVLTHLRNVRLGNPFRCRSPAEDRLFRLLQRDALRRRERLRHPEDLPSFGFVLARPGILGPAEQPP
ncbi:hypothetical protein SHIRM173S_01916 [Streptomyces hirsutus]